MSKRTDVLDRARHRARGEVPPVVASSRGKPSPNLPSRTVRPQAKIQLKQVGRQQNEIRQKIGWIKFKAAAYQNRYLITAVIVLVIGFYFRDQIPSLLSAGKNWATQSIAKLISQGQQVKVNGTPVSLVTGDCQTVALITGDKGIGFQNGFGDGFPKVGDQPTSWCPNRPDLWATIATNPRLAQDITNQSGLDESWTAQIQAALEQSISTGRLDLPGKVAVTSTAPVPEATAPPELPTEVLPPPTEPPLPIAEPTALPTAAPTQAPTPIAYLIEHKIGWAFLGQFMQRYDIAYMHGSKVCKEVDSSAYPLVYGPNPEDYVLINFQNGAWWPNWPEGTTICEINIRLEKPLDTNNWLMFDAAGYDSKLGIVSFWAYPYRAP